MKYISTSRGFWLAGVVLTVLAAAEAAAQGLGDAAKKEKARRGQPPRQSAPVKSYTQDDIEPKEPTTSAASVASTTETPLSASAPAGEATAASSLDAEANARRADEQRWRSAVAQAQERLSFARRQHEFLSSLNLVPGYVYVNERGRTSIRSIEHLQSLTAEARSELDAAERALEDLLEQARRAGVPPGWLR
jgi:hypothetical protein